MLLAIAKQYLLCSAIMGAVSAAVLLALPRLTRHASARSLFAALLAVVLAFIIPLRPPVPAFVSRQAQEALSPAPVIAETYNIPAMTPVIPPALPEPLGIVELPAPSPSPAQYLPLALAIIWLVGALAAWGFHSLRHRRFMRTVFRWSEPVDDPYTLDMFQQEKHALGIRRTISLAHCPFLTTPMLAGFLRPVILLPDMAIAPENLRLILRHELVHYRRGDLLSKALTLLAQAIHWYNPAIYLVANALSQQGELACDAAVVRGADEAVRKQYGTAILSIVRGQSGLRTALSTTFTGGKESMKQRIVSLLDLRSKRFGTLALCAVLVLIALTGAALAIDSTPPSETALAWETVFESFAPYGLLYDAATESLTFNGQPVRMFDDAGTYINPNGGDIDVYSSYDGQGNLIGIGIRSDEEFAARSGAWTSTAQTTSQEAAPASDSFNDTRGRLNTYLDAWRNKDYDTMASLSMPIDGESDTERTQRLYWAHNWWNLQSWTIETPVETDDTISYTVRTVVTRSGADAETVYLEYQPVFYNTDGEWLLDLQTMTTGMQYNAADTMTAAQSAAGTVTIVTDSGAVTHHIEPEMGTASSTQSITIAQDLNSAATAIEAHHIAPVTRYDSPAQTVTQTSDSVSATPGRVSIHSTDKHSGRSSTTTVVNGVSSTITTNDADTTVTQSVSASSTLSDSATQYAQYAPHGMIYDAATDSLMYNGQPVRYFIDILWCNDHALDNGYFEGGVTSHHSEHGTVDLRAVRDENDVLIGLETFHHDGSVFTGDWLIKHAR